MGTSILFHLFLLALIAVSTTDADLVDAAASGNLEDVENEIENLSTDINTIQNGKTALVAAAENGHLHIVKYLCSDSDLDPEANSGDGFTALMRAAEEGYYDIVVHLVEHCNADINYDRFFDNYNALTYALTNSHFDIACYLIGRGIDYDLVGAWNTEGNDALVKDGMCSFMDTLHPVDYMWCDGPTAFICDGLCSARPAGPTDFSHYQGAGSAQMPGYPYPGYPNPCQLPPGYPYPVYPHFPGGFPGMYGPGGNIAIMLSQHINGYGRGRQCGCADDDDGCFCRGYEQTRR